MIRQLSLFLLASSLIILLVACGSGGGSSNTPLTVTTSSVQDGVVNVAYNATLAATGGKTPYAWSVTSGSLPAGLSLSRAGVISGTPTNPSASPFGVSVTDSQSPPSIATASYSITINIALQFITTSLPSGSVGVAYKQTLAAEGGVSPYTWMVTQGSLPAGLSLEASSGVISGTPTAGGTSTFTLQVSDSQKPSATATESLSITVNVPPARGAALYVQGQPLGQGEQLASFAIASDGSLSPLPTLNETYFTLFLTASPKLPLLFSQSQGLANAFQVNPDYSVSAYNNSSLLPGSPGILSVDPTGADLYALGTIDSQGTAGATILTADGAFRSVGTVAIPNVSSPAIVFTPDSKLAFVSTCTGNTVGNLLSFVRNSDGTLSPAGSIATSSSHCLAAMAVSTDGKYLATDEVQVYSIAANGTVTPVLATPFTVTLNGNKIPVKSLAWDASGSYLIIGGWAIVFNHIFDGGVGVLSFSGTDLTETAPLTGGPVAQIQTTGSWVYAMPWGYTCDSACGNILGFNFLNGQLTPLPGSPYGFADGTMAIY